MDRIDFEELSLKSMDPSLGPKLATFGKTDVEVEKRASPVRCTRLLALGHRHL